MKRRVLTERENFLLSICLVCWLSLLYVYEFYFLALATSSIVLISQEFLLSAYRDYVEVTQTYVKTLKDILHGR